MKTRSLPLILGIVTAACLAGTAAADGTYKVSQTSKDEYRVGVKYRTEVKTGHLTHARLFVVAKDGWKVNAKFPFKVEITSPSGVSMEKTVFKKGDAKVMNDHKAVFKIPYKATSDGVHAFKAKVKLSVCKGTTKCLFPTETLKWTVTSSGE
ncbi:MAG: hypothetical protein JRG91_06675 [Deltaproteobacteria bacterium]|nr:hypothetical protein [Deltaproteobacteria bacterium]